MSTDKQERKKLKMGEFIVFDAGFRPRDRKLELVLLQECYVVIGGKHINELLPKVKGWKPESSNPKKRCEQMAKEVRDLIGRTVLIGEKECCVCPEPKYLISILKGKGGKEIMRRARLSLDAKKFGRMILKPGFNIIDVWWEPQTLRVEMTITGQSLETVREGEISPLISSEEVLKK